jgi:hypothetical protein
MRLALLGVLLAATSARADDSFETRAGAAQRERALDEVVWALTATCDKGDDVAQRQCRSIRDARAAAIAGKTLVVDGEPAALELGAWNPKTKSVSIRLAACVRCAGLDVDGKTWFLAAPHFDAGKLHPGYLYDNVRVFPDEAAAKAWLQSVKAVRVQLLVKAGARWSSGGKDGVAFDIVGYRAYSACDGAIVVANPASGPGDADRKICEPARSF